VDNSTAVDDAGKVLSHAARTIGFCVGVEHATAQQSSAAQTRRAADAIQVTLAHVCTCDDIEQL
jgi:hypothetical protein